MPGTILTRRYLFDRLPGAAACSALVTATSIVGSGLISPVASAAQSPEDVLSELKAAQMEFEQFRESKTPILRGGPVEGSCDERIGRMCIWFGGEDEADYPAELREVTRAREELVRDLTSGFEVAPHRWTLGQLVHYAVESGERGAGRRARSCVRDRRDLVVPRAAGIRAPGRQRVSGGGGGLPRGPRRHAGGRATGVADSTLRRLERCA